MNNLYKKHSHAPQSEPRTQPRALRTPYRIRFQDPLLSENDLRGNLPGCRYPLANGNSIEYQTKSATILRQYLSGYLFYIEIYEVNALEDFETAFIIESTQFFIFFMLEGGITFTDESERTMRHVQEQQFFPAYNRKGVN